MTLLPRSDVYFYPFSEGAVLFRQATRQLIILNQNAAIIWCLLNESGTLNEVASSLREKYQLDRDKAAVDVRGAVKFFLDNDLLQKGSVGENLEESSGENIISGLPQEAMYIPSVSDTYKKVFWVPGNILEIRYQDKEIGVMLDNVLAHLSSVSEPEIDTHLLVVPTKKQANCWSIYAGKTLVFPQVKKESVLPHLLQLIFDLSCKALAENFLFHAAVITRNSRAVLFPAHVGSGKTTLAAMLAKKDFQFFSDELAVIDIETFQVWPFLMPMSIKPGSLATLAPEYPELETLAVYFRPDGKFVRYLRPPAESLPEMNESASVAALVFPQYREGTDNRIIPLSKE